jgi:hypothetical protein
MNWKVVREFVNWMAVIFLISIVFTILLAVAMP